MLLLCRSHFNNVGLVAVLMLMINCTHTAEENNKLMVQLFVSMLKIIFKIDIQQTSV